MDRVAFMEEVWRCQLTCGLEKWRSRKTEGPQWQNERQKNESSFESYGFANKTGGK